MSVHAPGKRFIKKALARGKKLSVWTVDSLKKMKKYADQGVHYITTNRPADCLTLE